MRPRLAEMWRVCGGSLWLHCDDTAVCDLRMTLDAVCGGSAYRNMICWKRSDVKCDAKKSFGRVGDFILHYARPSATFNPQFTPLKDIYIATAYRHDDGDGRGRYRLSDLGNPRPGGYDYHYKGFAPPANGWNCPERTMQRHDREGRLHFPRAHDGRIQFKRYLKDSNGTPVGNVWTDISHLQNPDYPTEKPVALLSRIVEASSNPDDLVLDPFCGSGTTLLAAKRLGRRFIGCDVSADAVALATDRLSRELL